MCDTCHLQLWDEAPDLPPFDLSTPDGQPDWYVQAMTLFDIAQSGGP